MLQRDTIFHNQNYILSRHLQVKENRELIKVNQKIRGIMNLHKISQYQKISQYMKKRIEDNKVKRALSMRKKIGGEATLEKRESQLIPLSLLNIDKKLIVKSNEKKNHHATSGNYLQLLNVLEKNTQKKSKSKDFNILLRQIQQSYITDGQLPILSEKDSINNQEQQSREYKSKNKNEQNINNKRLISSIESISSNKKQGRKYTQRIKVNHDLSNIPYILKKRSKSSQRKFSSIRNQYNSKINMLNEANKILQKNRKKEQYRFLSKIKLKNQDFISYSSLQFSPVS